ncbi:RNA polymerase sigma factor [Sorangium atrum]|uniref:RNA polymerase sigma factor n=1 Tax=Sorangium atrum TaxID=2995308 RepID=A0ABT5C4J4_9BACT|nr:RNA polymerase sigma factor [Sorangium aterium]MDC0680603.1 RNA polymerase sigma factor [Sorangium aterium]
MQTRRRTSSGVHKRSAPGRRLPSFAKNPAVRLPVERIVAERRWLAALVTGSGVPRRDRDDLVQAVLMAAWMAVEAGRYRPGPSVHPTRALRGWLQGIAWRKASHYRERAWVRQEVPVADPWSVWPEPPRDDELLVDARERLLAVRLALSRLPRRDRKELALAAVGHGTRDIARRLRMPASMAVQQLGRARRRLRGLLER